MNSKEAASRIAERFVRRVRRDPNIHHAHLLVHSDRLNVSLNLAESASGGRPADPRQPYYIASVSKLFAAVLCATLVERGELGFDDPISGYLDAELLRELHVYKGKDYAGDIRVRHLLNHTSGLNDFFEDKPAQGASMLDLTLEESSRLWTPRDVVEWTKSRLKNRFPPGQGFHYSDTGYHLLGMLLENAAGRAYSDLLRDRILQPLGMMHTYLSGYSAPLEPNGLPPAGLYIRDRDISSYDSLSWMFAGGGLVSTTEDQLKFMKAVVKREIVSDATFAAMNDWATFFPGIDYGYGLMNIKPVFVIMPKKYAAWGNAGSTGSFLFYHPATDAYLIGSLNQFRYDRKGIRFMFGIIDILSKCVPEKR
ncbi:serine hydrolase domain-containing protein [Paenibacillaceae bacterium WGS1546]|uniref:serine hydrolase domain-containing protein n=1 Tax=Cohnella sp. WGS1546 TaxID=3366810 RepID=UPI00372D5603